MDSKAAAADAEDRCAPGRRLRNWYSLLFIGPIALSCAAGLARATAAVGLPAGIGWTIGVAAGIATFAIAYRHTGSGDDERFNTMSEPLGRGEALLFGALPFVAVAIAIGIVYLFHL